jgi:hypothetical protein
MFSFAKLIAIRSIEIVDIGDVDTAFFDRKEGVPVKMSLNVNVKVKTIVEPFRFDFAGYKLKVGEERGEPPARPSDQVETTTVSETVKVEALVDTLNGEYCGVKFLSADWNRYKGVLASLGGQ